MSKENTCPVCGRTYTQEYQFGLHLWASEKGYLPDCGRGVNWKANDYGAEAA